LSLADRTSPRSPVVFFGGLLLVASGALPFVTVGCQSNETPQSSGGATSTGGSRASTGGVAPAGGAGASSTGGGGSNGGGSNGGGSNGGGSNGGGSNGGVVSTGGTSGVGAAGPAGGSSTAGAGASNGGSTSGGAANTGGASGAASGSGGNPPNMGGGGSSAGTAAGGQSGKGDCGSLPLCDSFEATAVGSPPSSALWTIIPSSASGATVDSMGAHGSARSLKVVSSDRLYLRNSTVIGGLGDVVHARFYVRFAAELAQGHGALIVTHPTMVDQYSQQNELRFGSQDSVFHWNTDSDAANVPDVGPQGDAQSFKPAANTWYCVELTINTHGTLNTSIDGTDVPGLTADGTGTPNIDQSWVGSSASLSRYAKLADFNFGWQSYGGGALTVWYDDVALSSSPIGCQ
jgi:hypothetical protein